jgi:hypothetical protein
VADLCPQADRGFVKQVPREPHLAAVGAQHPEHDAHQGRLARPVESDESGDLARVQFEIEVEDPGAVGEDPGGAGGDEGSGHRGSPCRT